MTKYSALAAAAAAALADEFGINQSSVSKKVTVQQILDAVDLLADAAALADANKTLVTQSGVAKDVALSVLKDYFENAIVFAAGGSSANTWPKLTTGTLLSTPEAGALEMANDTLYATSEAGNRGVWTAEHFCRLASAYTLTSTTSEQKLFNASANGALSLAPGVYFFEMLLIITGLSATSGNGTIDILGAGTAVMADVAYFTNAVDGSTLGTAATDQASYQVAAQASSVIATAGTGTGIGAYVSGSFEITTAGTVIPSIALVTAAAGSVAAGSFFRCHRVGGANAAVVGDWS